MSEWKGITRCVSHAESAAMLGLPTQIERHGYGDRLTYFLPLYLLTYDALQLEQLPVLLE